MNVTMSQKMSNSRVFDTLLRHFGGSEGDETDIDPTKIAINPISDSHQKNSRTSCAKKMDFKTGYGLRTSSFRCEDIARRVSSSSAFLSTDAQAPYLSTRTPSPSICADAVMLSAGITSELALIDSSHNSRSSNLSHSSHNYPQPGHSSSSQQSINWVTSGMVPGSGNCSSNSSQNSPISSSPQSYQSTMHQNPSNTSGWGDAMSCSAMMYSSHSPVSTLPFDGNSDLIHNNSSFCAPSSSSDKNMVSAWSDESAMVLDNLASSMQTKVSKNKARKKHDASKPKRPLSAYNIFFKHERQRILDELPQEVLKQDAGKEGLSTGRRRKQLSAKDLLHRKVDFHRLAKMIGRRWREVPASELEQYKSIANADLQRYKKEMNAYKASTLIKEMRDQQQELQQDSSESKLFFQGFAMSEPLPFQTEQ